MDIKDILTLVNAGFTADMIAGFARKESKPAPAQASAPASAHATVPTPEPADELSNIAKRLDDLTMAIQANNTVSATAPTPKENDVNDVILNLIKEV